MIKIDGAFGVNLKDATDYLVEELIKNYNVSQRDAKRLLAECLIRSAICDEILGTANSLLGYPLDSF